MNGSNKKQTLDQRNGHRILLVEDDTALRELVRYTLERCGYRVDVCSDGRQASAYIQNHPAPKAVILKTLLQHVSGFELINEMANQHGWNSVPVLLLTTREDEETLRRTARLDNCEYVPIPFNPDTLAKQVSGCIQQEETNE